MDFTFSTEADEAAALAASIVTAEVTPERLKAVDGAAAEGSPRHDTALWRTLAEAGLLSLTAPEEYGGAGLGLLEAGRVLVELGRGVAPIAATPHVAAVSVLGATVGTGRDGSPVAAVLADAAAGTAILAVALGEELDPAPAHPAVLARESESEVAQGGTAGWVLSGVKTVIHGGLVATGFLVSATTSGTATGATGTTGTTGGTGLFLVRADDPGVRVAEQLLIDGDRAAVLTLDDARIPAERLIGAADGATAARLAQVLDALTCAEQLGVTEGALALTAAYATEREQFGRPIGSFQAVSQRLADGYIDTLGARLTLWQALWRLSEGLPAEVEVATARLWAADAGHRLAHTTVHVHGGVGIDLDGEAHRYFTTAKRLELATGGATRQSRLIGAILARG